MVISTKYTHADLLVMPDDGKRREILDGELIVSPSHKVPHQRTIGHIAAVFVRYLDRHAIGQILLSPLDVIFSEFDVLQPDVIFVRNNNRGILQDWIRGAPDIVIEVLSPSSISIDRGPKLKAYARFSVPEYWIVDPDVRAIEVYRQAEGGYELVSIYGEHDSVTSSLLPEFTLPVAQVFER